MFCYFAFRTLFVELTSIFPLSKAYFGLVLSSENSKVSFTFCILLSLLMLSTRYQGIIRHPGGQQSDFPFFMLKYEVVVKGNEIQNQIDRV